MKKILWLFPGQGSQERGMGQSFMDHFPHFRKKVSEIGDYLGIDLVEEYLAKDRVCPDAILDPLMIVTLSSLIFDEAQRLNLQGEHYALGHSLGEYSALYGARVLSLKDMVSIVTQRAKIMASLSETHPGGMMALIGAQADVVTRLCDDVMQNGDYITLANDNSPQQVVVSGTHEALNTVKEMAPSFGIKRCIPLSVSGPYHSALMQDGVEPFKKILKSYAFSSPEMKHIMNRTGQVIQEENYIDLLSEQLVHPVLFRQAIAYATALPIDLYIEVGPGQVLSNLVRRMQGERPVISIRNPEDISQLEEWL
jgi:[acyl-carrier-protein] S-malonyltransferase